MKKIITGAGGKTTLPQFADAFFYWETAGMFAVDSY